MKTTRSQNTKQSKQGMVHTPRPEIRDNLDSRKNLEQDINGDNSTHHKKNLKDEKRKRS